MRVTAPARRAAEPRRFRLVEPAHVAALAPFRFAFTRLTGPYTPWARCRALDDVAEALERAGVARLGPPVGVYYDLPYSDRAPDEWIADLGFPVPPRVRVPTDLGLFARRMPERRVARLRYDGDLQSFPGALAAMLEWAESAQLPFEGPLVERFHVSDPLTGREERDVMIALEALPEALPRSA